MSKLIGKRVRYRIEGSGYDDIGTVLKVNDSETVIWVRTPLGNRISVGDIPGETWAVVTRNQGTRR